MLQNYTSGGRAAVSLHRMPTLTLAASPGPNALSFEHVTISYGARRVLDDVSFAVGAGRFVGILGPNGAGKTTLLRAILGLVAPASGRIDVLGAAPRRGNRLIGYMPQLRRTVPPVPLTGFEMALGAVGGLKWGWPLSSRPEREAVWEALERVGAADLAKRPVTEMSGGERQRIAIAQALVGRPRLLLLDEPLISLDAAHQRGIVELVHELGQRLGIAVLFCSHELNPLLHVVDEILYLGGGHAAIGSVDAVVNSAVLSRLYGTHIDVIRAEGRIFVLANEGEIDGGGHAHDLNGHAGGHAHV
jgi:zinc/manganese transport system ATP-binding protein